MIPHQEYLSIYVPLDLSSSITQKSSQVKGVMGGKHFRNLGQLHSPLLPFPQSWFPSSKGVGRGWYLVHGCFRAVPAWQLWWPHSFWKASTAVTLESSTGCRAFYVLSFFSPLCKRGHAGTGLPVARACLRIQPLTPASPIYFTEPTGDSVGINLHTPHLGAADNGQVHRFAKLFAVV